MCNTSNQIILSTRFACTDKMCFIASEMSCRNRVSQMYVYDDSEKRQYPCKHYYYYYYY
jgi:hypothetical protein